MDQIKPSFELVFISFWIVVIISILLSFLINKESKFYKLPDKDVRILILYIIGFSTLFSLSVGLTINILSQWIK